MIHHCCKIRKKLARTGAPFSPAPCPPPNLSRRPSSPCISRTPSSAASPPSPIQRDRKALNAKQTTQLKNLGMTNKIRDLGQARTDARTHCSRSQ